MGMFAKHDHGMYQGNMIVTGNVLGEYDRSITSN